MITPMLRKTPTQVWGVTGPVGAGKSAFCEILEASGAVNIEVDSIGHQMLSDPLLRDRLAKTFGCGILESSGEVDRRELGAVAFKTAQSRQKLNSIMHPPMISAVEENIAASRSRGTGVIIIINAALLFEMNLARLCDRIIYVDASPDIRLDRLVTTRGWSREKSLMRLASQDPPPATDNRITVIENNGSFEELKLAAERLASEQTTEKNS